MTVDPREHDEAEAELFHTLGQAQSRLHSAAESLHRQVGDTKKDRWTRRERWALTMDEVIVKAEQAAPSTLKAYLDTLAEVQALHAAIDEAERVWREHGWSRYILCLSANGHIHNYTGCHTLRANTQLQWHPEFSGLSEADAVNGVGSRDGLGPILCTHCYPSAPVEFKRDPAEVNRERTAGTRDAERAARDEAKAAKNLTEDQQFKNHMNDWVRTVAAAKQALRDERELFYYYGHGPHCWHTESIRAAEMARNVLLAREARQAGTGATQTEIDKIIATADKKHRKEAGL